MQLSGAAAGAADCAGPDAAGNGGSVATAGAGNADDEQPTSNMPPKAIGMAHNVMQCDLRIEWLPPVAVDRNPLHGVM